MRWSRDRSRVDAGRVLADEVAARLPAGPVVVLGLPRGGVPVAAEVAHRLGAPLDVLTVRKVGTPGHVELAIGAVASGDLVVRNDELIARLGLSADEVAARVDVARRELAERDARLRGDRAPAGLAGDGRARRRRAGDRGDDPRRRRRRPAGRPARWSWPCPSDRPTPSPTSRRSPTRSSAHASRPDFVAVGEWYREFGETTDAEVIALLGDA